MKREDSHAGFTPEKVAGIAFVALLHAAALWGLWQHRLLPLPVDVTTLFVNFVAPPTPEKKEEPKRPPPPKPKSVEKPQQRQIVAETPQPSPIEHVAPSPPPDPAPAPVVEAPAMPLPPAPLNLGTELALTCPERTAPAYPPLSRRFGETGRVVLRVELDEQGRVAAARVETGSGHDRLDQVALAAVRTWRCSAPRRDGQAVRAVARQPFNFILQGN